MTLAIVLILAGLILIGLVLFVDSLGKSVKRVERERARKITAKHFSHR